MATRRFCKKNKPSIDVRRNLEMIIENYELVISVHCFQFFPEKLVNSVRCINLHPGYNPINRGWYPQVFAIIKGLKIGATIHEMDAKLDNGPIIARSFVEYGIEDNSKSIYDRVLLQEIKLLTDNFEDIIFGTYKTILPENRGDFFSKKDYSELCKINLACQGSYLEFYNHLRALTHGDYWNAWFLNEQGEKVFIRLEVKVDRDAPGNDPSTE